MSALTIASAIVLALLFLAASKWNLSGKEASVAMRTHLGVPAPAWRLIGVSETLGAIGVLIGLAVTPLGVAAAAGLTSLSAGGVASHLRVGDSLKVAGPALLGLILALATGSMLLL